MATWNIDPMHSEIGFKVKHLMISTVRGMFTKFDGKIEAPDNTFENATATFTIEAASVSTNSEQRDGHLKSADFFNVDNHPNIIFLSKSFSKDTSDGDFIVVGDLTMKGVTKEVTLKVTFNGISVGMDKARVAAFDVTGSLSRKDFGLLWNAPIETGGMVLSDEVKIDLAIEAKEL